MSASSVLKPALRRVFSICLFVSLVSCGESNSEQQSPDSTSNTLEVAASNELIRGITFEPDSLDPHKAMLQSEALEDLLEGLVVPTQDGGIAPGAAHSWSTEDGLTYHFALRRSAKWSNGDPVTANDFVFAWQRAVDPETASSCIEYFSDFGVANAEQIANGQKEAGSLGVRALDPYTLLVTLEQPIDYFPKILTSMCFFPLHRGTLEKHLDEWTRPGKFIGNGAFKLLRRNVGESIELLRNHEYWLANSVRLDKVTYLNLSNTALLTRYLADEIDITSSLPDDQFPRINRELPDEIVWEQPPGVFGFQVNTLKPPLNNPLVRRALAYALDRHIINTSVFNDGDPEAYTFSPPELLGLSAGTPAWKYWSQARREQHARELLTQAGYTKEKPLKFQMSYARDDNNTKMATAASAMWKNVLGAEVSLHAQEFKTLVERYRNADFSLVNWAHGASFNEPGELYASCCLNSSHYSNERLAQLLKKARIQFGQNSRNAYYSEAEEILSEDMPFIPVSHINRASLVKPHVKGIHKKHVRLPLSKDLWLTSR